MMKCTRCAGLMVADDLLDLQESYVPMWMRAWRCVACGNIVDPLINHHRVDQRARAMSVLPRPVDVSFIARSAKTA